MTAVGWVDPRTGLAGPAAGAAVALVLRDGIAAGAEAWAAARAVEAVLPALLSGPAEDPVVLLGAGPGQPLEPGLALAGCVLRRDGEIAATGAAGRLGPPGALLARLAPLEPGAVVVLGPVTPRVPVGPGDRLALRFAGLGAVDGQVR